MKKINYIILTLTLFLIVAMTSCASTPGGSTVFYGDAIRKEISGTKRIKANDAIKKIESVAEGAKLYLDVGVDDSNIVAFCDAVKARNDIKIYLKLNVSGVTSIYPEAFLNATSLRHVTIEGPVTTIERKAFAGCTNLYDVYLADTVNYIDQSAFLYCMSMITIHVADSTYKSISGTDFFVDPMEITAAMEVLSKHEKGTINLDIFIEDGFDTMALLDQLTFLNPEAYVNLTLSLASDLETFNKIPFLQNKHVKELQIVGNAKIVY